MKTCNVIKQEYPKVLIICHNLFDDSNNIGKTLVSLFRDWPKDKLAQIYFRNDPPSFRYCNEYYCITDKDILKSVVSLGRHKAGHVVDTDNSLAISNLEENLYQIGNHRRPMISLARDILWDLGKWKTKDFAHWLVDIVKPDVILFAPNDYCLAYKVALHVEKLLKIKMIPFYMDDAFYWGCKTGAVDKLRRKQLRTLAAKIHKNVDTLFTICDKMSEEYARLFKKQCVSFVNSVEIRKTEEKKNKTNQLLMMYLGNLHSGRWKSIVEVGAALDALSDKNDVCCELQVYSASVLEPAVKEAFDNTSSIQFMGRIAPDMVAEKQRQSDMLLHVEAFDLKNKNSTRLSLSTKIPEYLGAGACVFAYGPHDIASIDYLKKNGIAQVCTKAEDLLPKLEQLLYDQDYRLDLAKKGKCFAEENHDILSVSRDFQSRIKSIQYEHEKDTCNCT